MKTSLLALMAVLCTVLPASGQEPALADSVPALLDAGRNRLAFLPTARTLPSGTRWVADQAYLIPSAGIAPTEAITLGVGAPLFSLAVPRTFVVAPKLRLLQRPGVQGSVGTVSVVGVSAGFDGLDPHFGSSAGYGVVTVGNEERALTLGLMQSLHEWPVGSAIFGGAEVELPALRRASGKQRVKLLAEAMAGTGHDGLSPSGWPTPAGALSIRFFDPRVAVDVSFVVLNAAGEAGGARGFQLVPLPLLSFSYLF